MEREARHAWFAEADKVAHAEGVRGNSSQPFRLRRLAKANQGLRSFHSLDPWLLSVHPSGVLIHALMRQVQNKKYLCASGKTSAGSHFSNWPSARTSYVSGFT